MVSYARRLGAALLVLALGVGCARKESSPAAPKSSEIDARYQSGAIHLTVSASKITVADKLRVTVTVKADSEPSVAWPWPADARWTKADDEVTSAPSSASALWTYEWTCFADAVGPQILPPISITVGKVTTRTDPVKIEVVPLSEGGTELRDIAPPIEKLPYPPFFTPVHLVLLAAGLIFVAMAGFFLRWRLNRRPLLPPRAQALHDLARLEHEGGSSPRRQGERMSQILRTYLEKEFALPVLRRTTREFLAEVSGDIRFSAQQQVWLREFLNHCDIAKFASARWAVQERAAMLSDCRDFILTCPPAEPSPVR